KPEILFDRNVLETFFPQGQELNLGILNGEASGNLADVDLDTQIARLIAGHFLKPTGWVFGREGAPCSHWLYVTDKAIETASVEFRDLKERMLLEVRGTGGQTVWPPSTHPSGETITWYTHTEPARISREVLLAAAAQIASVALLAQHWPAKGTRRP